VLAPPGEIAFFLHKRARVKIWRRQEEEEASTSHFCTRELRPRRSLHRRYQFEALYLHWAEEEDQHGGSEHSVGGRKFAGEAQLLAYNADLFSNLSQALGRPHGVAAVAVMIQQHPTEANPALKSVSQHLKKVGSKWVRSVTLL